METESQRRAKKLLKELAELREKGSYEDRRQLLLHGLGGVEHGRTESRPDSLSPLLKTVGDRENEARATLRNLYSRCRQELGNTTSQRLYERLVEGLNALPAYPHELAYEKGRIAQENMRRREPKGFIAWYLDTYCED